MLNRACYVLIGVNAVTIAINLYTGFYGFLWIGGINIAAFILAIVVNTIRIKILDKDTSNML